jgi:hypothetical protein
MNNVKLVTIFSTSLLLAGCFDKEVTNKDVQTQKAAEAAKSIQFTENAEIDNIKQRLQLTANPGLLGFVVLLNESGQPIMYTGVKGKITSGSKRLTPPDNAYNNSVGMVVRQAASDEGTYGHSSEYVFFWTTNGQYVQWNGKYLYSDKPFRLSVEPLVVSVK